MTNEYAQKLAELQELLEREPSDGVSDPHAERREQLLRWIEDNSDSEEAQCQLDAFISQGIEGQKKEIASLRMQIEGSYDILPLSYIARNYFGKSRAWLYQRLNGLPVRGHVYTLNPEQKRTFNMAVQDIAQRIGALYLA